MISGYIIGMILFIVGIIRLEYLYIDNWLSGFVLGIGFWMIINEVVNSFCKRYYASDEEGVK